MRMAEAQECVYGSVNAQKPQKSNYRSVQTWLLESFAPSARAYALPRRPDGLVNIPPPGAPAKVDDTHALFRSRGACR
jgi:hypothetical protein